MITAIDKNTALVLIDLQKGITGRASAHPVADVLRNAARLLAAFREARLPVVIVNVNPIGAPSTMVRAERQVMPADAAGQQKALEAMQAADFFSIVPEIEVRPGEDIRITKQTWNAFARTGLHETLQQRGVTGIVLAGISTSIGVEGTARAANEFGYNLTFAIDAMTDALLAAHEHSLNVIFPRIGELGTTEEIVGWLGR
jgi:nicotinamidase-related amidase